MAGASENPQTRKELACAATYNTWLKVSQKLLWAPFSQPKTPLLPTYLKTTYLWTLLGDYNFHFFLRKAESVFCVAVC